uniref:Amyloid beta precursor protein (cytoplasmic tail) binding protein 2 n=1 Tax=Nothobranchius furzeri TaxID=105023 RepID=A0A8C6L163_NOTFU
MAAVELEWIPETLYNTAISAVVDNYSRSRRDIRSLPENIQFDVYYKLYQQGRLCQLGGEFCELEVFAKVLRASDKRHLLHHCFQALMDHGVKVASVLANSFSRRCSYIAESDAHVKEKAIQFGFVLGGFLSDAGWYGDAEKVFLSCLQLCTLHSEVLHCFRAVECCVRLLHVRNGNCKYHLGEETFKLAQSYMDKLAKHGHQANKAALYGELCALLFAKSHYDEAYRWCIEAMKEITPGLPVKVVVDVLRQASKACVVKREFRKAEQLIKHAVFLAREHFGHKHPKYSDTLLDYGFYLLNVDNICQSVAIYQTALDIRQSVFGGKNIHVATAHEDLAYSSYVHQYSSGKFDNALFHAERAIDIITHILPEDHLLLASSKRVKALILEEIAIDCHNKETEERLLQEAHDLHLSSLQLAKKAFGEFNVQTAKHYGNLGRLYQSMRKFKVGQNVLLFTQSWQVLNMSHVLKEFLNGSSEKKMTVLFAAGKKLFGEGYSGLEYDYRGLIKLYNSVGNYEKVFEYHNVLTNWNRLRDRQFAVADALEDVNTTPQQTQEVVRAFLQAQSLGPTRPCLG